MHANQLASGDEPGKFQPFYMGQQVYFIFCCEMLKFARTPTGSLSGAATSSSSTSAVTVSALRPVINRKTSFVTSSCGYSKATIVIKNLSLPLAWPSEEYFGAKREKRVFTVQLVLKTADGREMFSKPVENVDRGHIDVVFDDTFYVEDQPPDFTLELTVYCRRTDENANIVQTLSRSMSKNVANSLKRYVQSWNTTNLTKMQQLDSKFIENYRDPSKMCPLGSAMFKLQNASLSGRKHNYAIRLLPHISYGAIPKPQLLPLFGQISLVLLVQPLSLAAPIAQGTLDVFYVEGGILLQKLFCILQGTFLKCFNCNPQEITQFTKPDMLLPITEHTQVETTAFQTALRLKLIDQDSSGLRHFVCVTGNQHSFLGWKNALKLQIKDAETWGGFAISSSNPHGAAIPPKPPKPGTLTRNVHFEGSETAKKSSTLGYSTASEPRYGFELQSTRRPRPPVIGAFKQPQDSPRPMPRAINATPSNSPQIEKKKQKPTPKPRANSEVPVNSPYVISLKVGQNDGLPEPTHSGERSSSSSSSESTINSTNADRSSTPTQTDSKGSSLIRDEQRDTFTSELPPKFVYGVGIGLQLVRNRPPTAVNRSATLYNSRAKNEMTRL